MRLPLQISIKLAIVFFSSFIFNLSCKRTEFNTKVDNVATFGRLYGYVRWFCPSEAAQQLNWDKFAIYGIKLVEDAKNSEELSNILFDLFEPIVPEINISTFCDQRDHNGFDSSLQNSGTKFKSWQHLGLQTDQTSSYISHLHNSDPSDKLSFISRIIDLDTSSFLDQIVLTVDILHIDSSSITAELFIRPINKSTILLSSKDFLKGARRINLLEGNFSRKELKYMIPKHTEKICYGIMVSGKGNLSIDNVALTYINNSLPIQSFEPFNDSLVLFGLRDWSKFEYLHKIRIVNDTTNNGYLKFELRNALFDRTVKNGEVLSLDIGGGLCCTIPISLEMNEGMRGSNKLSSKFNVLNDKVESIDISEELEIHRNLASTIILWNIVQHFHPYLMQTEADWENQLRPSLKSTYDTTNKLEFNLVLNSLLSKVNDGHGFITGLDLKYHLPVRMELIENQIVITNTLCSELEIGDIIQSIDGINIFDFLEYIESFISGSSQLKKCRALNILGGSNIKRSSIIKIIRDNILLTFEVERTEMKKSIFYNPIPNAAKNNAGFVEMGENIYLLNLSSCSENEFNIIKEKLINSKAIIIDIREGTNEINLLDIIPHLIDKNVESPYWEYAEIIYPDQNSITWQKRRWILQPSNSRFKGKIFLLLSSTNISSLETAIAIFDHYDIGETIGETTAGCNGNINSYFLPCDFYFFWTGMKVKKHDDSELYTIGYQPDYNVEQTIEGVKNEKDEVLEFALQLANKQSKN